MGIIGSLLDQDQYKFSMQQVFLHRFPQLHAEYKFKCRTLGVDLVKYIKEIKAEIRHLCTLRFTEKELSFLSTLRFLKPDYIEFLRLFQLQEKFVSVGYKNGELDITISGPVVHIMMFEIFILAIISELYGRDQVSSLKFARDELDKKINFINYGKEHLTLVDERWHNNDFKFIDLGTRRRHSFEWQEEVIVKLKNSGIMKKNFLSDVEEYNSFVGTSNVYFSMKYNLTPMGTQAHEFLQAMQAAGPRLVDSQKFALENWVQEYRGDLGIALTDVITMDAFLKDFDLFFCKLFDGVRHDSGCPFVWTDKILDHYKKNRIDARSKTLVYSNSLNFQKCQEIYKKYNGKARLLFGIGNHLMNDCGYQHLNMVIKMTKCNGQSVAKISDDFGKGMCEDQEYESYLRSVFGVADEVRKCERCGDIYFSNGKKLKCRCSFDYILDDKN